MSDIYQAENLSLSNDRDIIHVLKKLISTQEITIKEQLRLIHKLEKRLNQFSKKCIRCNK